MKGRGDTTKRDWEGLALDLEKDQCYPRANSEVPGPGLKNGVSARRRRFCTRRNVLNEKN